MSELDITNKNAFYRNTCRQLDILAAHSPNTVDRSRIRNNGPQEEDSYSDQIRFNPLPLITKVT